MQNLIGTIREALDRLQAGIDNREKIANLESDLLRQERDVLWQFIEEKGLAKECSSKVVPILAPRMRPRRRRDG